MNTATWSVWLVEQELNIRLACFLGIFTLMALWEVFRPARTLTLPRQQRWLSNLSIAIINTILLRILFPTAAVGFALWVNQSNLGLLPLIFGSDSLNSSSLSFPWLIIASILLLDLAIYFQHLVFHRVPVFWKLHQVHHADIDIDVTTGARFHFIEIILSMIIKFAVILILGPSFIAVILFEVLLNATAMFNHSNVALSTKFDRWLRLVLVTPDMHRVHHSSLMNETNSNYGFNVPWWDRLFGTYIAQPSRGHQNMEIGLEYQRDPNITNKLLPMLSMPFIQASHLHNTSDVHKASVLPEARKINKDKET